MVGLSSAGRSSFILPASLVLDHFTGERDLGNSQAWPQHIFFRVISTFAIHGVGFQRSGAVPPTTIERRRSSLVSYSDTLLPQLQTAVALTSEREHG